MPQVIFAPGVIQDLQRLREFLRPKNPLAAKRAAETILKAMQVLGHQLKLADRLRTCRRLTGSG